MKQAALSITEYRWPIIVINLFYFKLIFLKQSCKIINSWKIESTPVMISVCTAYFRKHGFNGSDIAVSAELAYQQSRTL